MQGTVSRYDAGSGSGAVLTDTGIELPFDAAAIAEAPVRFLRAGQRVRIDTTGSGAGLTILKVRFITIES